ncbi:MAG: FAD-dependent monooxygenase, partial [Actinomycetota bacterium]|nr:FAD-dependent monooxygenase [Actinomycetota bacterium]
MTHNVQTIATPLLIVGRGPAALVIAKVVSGRGLPCLVVGHETLENAESVMLDPESLEILEPHGVLAVLRPYAAAQDPFTITPLAFENGLKHHCVADMLITVYDDMY